MNNPPPVPMPERDANALIAELIDADRSYRALTVYASSETWLKYGERRSKAIARLSAALSIQNKEK